MRACTSKCRLSFLFFTIKNTAPFLGDRNGAEALKRYAFLKKALTLIGLT